jgi:hypothetical protein
MPLPSKHDRENYTFRDLRRGVGDVEDPKVREALFALLGLVHDLTDEIDDLNYKLGRLEERQVQEARRR